MKLHDATIDELITMLVATEQSVGPSAIEARVLRDELKLRDRRRNTPVEAKPDHDRQKSSTHPPAQLPRRGPCAGNQSAQVVGDEGQRRNPLRAPRKKRQVPPGLAGKIYSRKRKKGQMRWIDRRAKKH